MGTTTNTYVSLREKEEIKDKSDYLISMTNISNNLSKQHQLSKKLGAETIENLMLSPQELKRKSMIAHLEETQNEHLPMIKEWYDTIRLLRTQGIIHDHEYGVSVVGLGVFPSDMRQKLIMTSFGSGTKSVTKDSLDRRLFDKIDYTFSGDHRLVHAGFITHTSHTWTKKHFGIGNDLGHHLYILQLLNPDFEGGLYRSFSRKDKPGVYMPKSNELSRIGVNFVKHDQFNDFTQNYMSEESDDNARGRLFIVKDW